MTNKTWLPAMLAVTLTACGGNNNSTSVEPEPPIIPPPPTAQLIAFDDDDHLQANITWTTHGVPHITADNLESLGYGSGYAYARDNLCILADQIVKITSQRAKYFGPDSEPGNGDFAHLISDFGFKALQLTDKVEAAYEGLSDNTRALTEGYVAGYNKYLQQTGVDNLSADCAGQPWVQPITAQQVLAYILSIAQLTSGAQTGLMELSFFANPGDDFAPYPSASINGKTATANKKAQNLLANMDPKILDFDIKDLDSSHLGSNGWGLGKDFTENGKGAMLANPHFPHNGNLRFWQSHSTIPGVLNVMGASVQGFPGIINIGYNDSVSWTHTVTEARHFAAYQLTMDPEQPLTYLVDGEPRQLEKKTFTVEVATGDGNTVNMSKDYYYSAHGLMLEFPGSLDLFAWNDTTAFSYKDANADNLSLVDHWLAMNMADNLDEFKQSFVDFSGIPFTNTIYADKEGNTLFIDDTPVLNFSPEARALMATEPSIVFAREFYGLDVLPGNNSVFDTDGLVPYNEVPKLERTDYVQNANDSFWATNPAALMPAHPIGYGSIETPLSLRTRMGLKMLGDSGGEDGKFSLVELEQALLSNRLYLSELVKDSLLQQCQAQADTPVMLQGEQAIDIAQACTALGNWDGVAGLDSRSAHIFREFAFNFDHDLLSTPFDATDPANTPNTLADDPKVLQTFALAVANLAQAGFSMDATLSQMQFVEKPLPGSLGGPRLPWAGSTSTEGGFNVFSNYLGDDETLLSKHRYPELTDVLTGEALYSGLTAEGYQVQRGSSWMFVLNFTDEGPSARGLLLSSQSSHSESEFFSDQTRLYSDSVSLRPLYFSAADIAANTIETLDLSDQ